MNKFIYQPDEELIDQAKFVQGCTKNVKIQILEGLKRNVSLIQDIMGHCDIELLEDI